MTDGDIAEINTTEGNIDSILSEISKSGIIDTDKQTRE